MSSTTLFIAVFVALAVLVVAVGYLLTEREALNRRLAKTTRCPPAQPRPVPRDAEPHPPSPRQPQDTPTAAPDRLILGTVEAPDVVIERCPAPALERLTPIDLRSNLVAELSPLLQHAPGLAMAGAGMASPDLYLVTFSQKVAAGLATGQYDLAQASAGGWRGFAVGPDGIVGQGVLQRFDMLQMAGAGLAMWQVVSAITATYHLHKIQTQLKDISRGVDAIQRTLENARQGRLAGKYRYLANTFESLQALRLDRDSAMSLKQQLETIEREVLEDLLKYA